MNPNAHILLLQAISSHDQISQTRYICTAGVYEWHSTYFGEVVTPMQCWNF